jgi:hypothetical protein
VQENQDSVCGCYILTMNRSCLSNDTVCVTHPTNWSIVMEAELLYKRDCSTDKSLQVANALHHNEVKALNK